MSSTFLKALQQAQQSKGPLLGGTFYNAIRASSPSSKITFEQLQQQEQELRLLQQQTGARGIEQDKPGALTRIIDFLSRPNFALAGFSEELFGGERSVTRGVQRALTEIFSGVGGIQGEKRAFGEVLENLGVGTKTLADAFPALEGTWVGNFGSRGLAGLALDIGTDPLTYITFGASTGLRVATSKGIRYLNRSGVKLRGELMEKNVRLARESIKGTDKIAEGRIWDRATIATEKEFEELYGVGGEIVSELLEPGGAKLYGKFKIPGSDKLGVPLHRTLQMLPDSITEPIVKGAQDMQRGMLRMVRGIFSPEGALANLPEPLRARAVQLTNSFFRSSISHRGHLMEQMAPLKKIYRRLEKKDPKIGERWYDVRERELPKSAIKNPEELAAFDATMDLYDKMGQTLIDHGVLGEEKFRLGYIFHQYKNIEELAQYHPRPGVVRPGTKSMIDKERKFDTYRIAEEETKRIHELSLRLMSRGEAKRLYPVLEPEFDVFKNMEAYIGQHADVLARKAWREEMVATFGKSLDELGVNGADLDALYEAGEIGVKTTKGAPREFNPERLPIIRAIDEGDIEKALVDTFGPDGAQYVAVKSKATANELAYLPKAVADALDSVNSSLFNTKEYKEFGKLLKGFDWLNNNFKWGVYTLWPASLVRDGYSNLFLSGLRIGVNAISPKLHRDTIAIMASRNLDKVFANSGFTRGQLRDMGKTFGVWVPGQVFVEQTGKFKLGKFRRLLTEKRTLIENEARMMLWLDEIRHGVDPRKAADTVGQFLFNYGEVSRVERDLFRRLIPFYTFTRKNVELQARILRENPGRVINQLKPFRGRQEENEQMVKFEAEGLKLRLDKDGKTLHAMTGIDLPLRNLDTIWAGGFGATGRRLMGMITPVLKVPVEVTVGRDLFTGGDLKRTRADTLGRIAEATRTPKPVKDWLGYKKTFDDAGRPIYTMDGQRYALLVRSWMFSRAFSTSDRQFREYLGDRNIAAGLLDVMTGIRVKDIDLDQQARRKLFRRIRQTQDVLVRRGVLAEFNRPFAPREQGQLQ